MIFAILYRGEILIYSKTCLQQPVIGETWKQDTLHDFRMVICVDRRRQHVHLLEIADNHSCLSIQIQTRSFM